MLSEFQINNKKVVILRYLAEKTIISCWQISFKFILAVQILMGNLV